MELSIVIVNYNVRFFLEHCLLSVYRSDDSVEFEVIVVDNDSRDGSREMVAEKFPQVRYIQLNENLGFSKANNVGIEESKGEYVLLLNPDTVVGERTFSKCIDFMKSHSDCGGLGVYMIDGQGKYLPESKRGLPTPEAAFYKMFGLSTLFPKSKVFGKYHLGFLDPNKVHEVDVLSGAFMMMPKRVLEKVGLLDETFFMYGEDIDLSYRIVQAGFKNYYFPDTHIIHYKGESTKKQSINYVFVFYRAMVIFAKKHFEKGRASLFGLLINFAIYFRAFISLLTRLIGGAWQLIIDFVLTYLAFLFTTAIYENYADKDFSLPFISIALPIFSAVCVTTLHFSAAYDAPFKPSRYIKGWVISFAALLALYALLPEAYRFSRAVIIIAGLMSIPLGLLWRWITSVIAPNQFRFSRSNQLNRLVVGDENSLARVTALFDRKGIESDFIAGVLYGESRDLPIDYVANADNINEAIVNFNVDEIIYDAEAVSYEDIIAYIQMVQINSQIRDKIAVGSAPYLIGSHSIYTDDSVFSDDQLDALNLNAIGRNKRLFDIVFSIIALLISPLLIWFVDQKSGFLKNLFQSFFGSASWVGYDPRGASDYLPKMKRGVSFEHQHVIWPQNAEKLALKANATYLKEHSILKDFRIVMRHLDALGNTNS